MMRKTSTLTQEQQHAVIALFQEGYGPDATATRLRLRLSVVDGLHLRWRVRGAEVLVPRKNKVYSHATKCEVVRRFHAGETKVALAQEYDIAAPKRISRWARIVERDGEDGLLPKPKGRPEKDPDAPPPMLTELELLRQQNQYLRAENAYLKKLKALNAHEQQ